VLLLPKDCKQNQLPVSEDLQDQLKNVRNFLCKSITADESWICGGDPEIKQQFSLWKSRSPHLKKTRRDGAGQVNLQHHVDHFL
jgi:hypothetical protein